MALFRVANAGADLELTGLELVPNSSRVSSISVNEGDLLILSLRSTTDVITGADLIGSLDGRIFMLDGSVLVYLGLYKATSTTVTTSSQNGFAGVSRITTA